MTGQEGARGDAAAVVLRNEDVAGVVVEIPAGHHHLRTTVTLVDGTSLTFLEATIAAIVRAYVAVKTHPRKTRVALTGSRLQGGKRGYAEWQLLEES
jgi:hypothetical protein